MRASNFTNLGIIGGQGCSPEPGNEPHWRRVGGWEAWERSRTGGAPEARSPGLRGSRREPARMLSQLTGAIGGHLVRIRGSFTRGPHFRPCLTLNRRAAYEIQGLQDCGAATALIYRLHGPGRLLHPRATRLPERSHPINNGRCQSHWFLPRSLTGICRCPNTRAGRS